MSGRRRRTVRSLDTLPLESVQRDHSGFRADFDAVYTQLRARISGTMSPTDQESLVPLIMTAIRLVEEIARFSGDGGSAKQQLVMALLTRIIEDSGMDAADKVTVQAILEQFGPSIIDGLVSASNGRLLASGLKKFFQQSVRPLFRRCGLCT